MSEEGNNQTQNNETGGSNENNENENLRKKKLEFNKSLIHLLSSISENKCVLSKIIVVGVIIIGIIIAIPLMIIFLKKKKKTPHCDQECGDNNGDNITIVNLNYKINQVINYENIETKITQIKIDNESPTPQKIKYIGNYSFIIYDFNYETKVYNACALLFNLTIEKGKKIEFLVKNNLDIPLMKVDFKNETREIINLEIPKDIDSKLAIYIYEFIEKIIPDISYTFNENKNNYNIFKDENNTTRIQKKLNGSAINHMEDSINENSLDIFLNNGTITDVKQFKKYIFNTNGNDIFNFSVNSNFSDDTLNETFSSRKDFIKELSQSFDSNMKLKSNDINEKYINEIKNLLKKISFIKYSPSESLNKENEKRRLNSKKINNKLLSKNQLRNLYTMIIDPYYQPIYLDFPLFKSNFVGAKFGLVTKIGFLPQIGLFVVELYLKKNNDQLIEIYKHEQKTNFGDILVEIDNVFLQTGNLIINDIDKNINVTYEKNKNQINDELNKLFYELNLTIDFANIYVQPLEKLFTDIKKASSKAFVGTNNNTNKTSLMLTQLLNEIKGNNNQIVNLILESTENSINLYLQEIYEKLEQIYEPSIVFLNEVKNDVEYAINLMNERFDVGYKFDSFDICTFYDIKDTIQEILNTFSLYEEKIKEAILFEKKKFDNYIKSELEKNVYPPLKENEEISLQMKSNLVINEGIKQSYGEHYYLAEKRRNDIIEFISSFRGKINEIFGTILEKINSKYNFTLLNETLDYYDKINETEINLIEYLREKELIKFDQNISIYVEDIKSIVSIYINVIKIRQNAYQKYIKNNLNEISIEDNINDFVNLLKTTFDSKINNIIDKIKENNFKDGILLSNELNNEIPNMINLNNYLTQFIKEKYNNTTLFQKMADDYYSEVIPAFNEFNNTFLNEIFKSHIKEYVSRPTEVENKLRIIQNNEEYELNNIIDDINSLIINNINNELKYGYEKINNILKGYLNYFYEKLPKSLYEGDENYIIIEENIIKISNKLSDENNNFIPLILYNRKKRDEFNIKKYFENYEFKITNNIGKIIDELSIYFDEYVCITNEDICKEDGSNILSSLDQYNFQIAKMRDSISHLKLIVNISEEMIDESILSNLNETEFLKLYEDNFNYGSDALISQILEFLEVINNQTNTYIDGLTKGIEGKIIDIYNEKINNGLLEGLIEAIAKKVFIDPYDYKIIVKNYLTNPCGPIPRIMNIFNEEIIYYTEKGMYSFDRESYDNDFKKLKEEISNSYKNFESTFLSDVQVNDKIKNILNEKIIFYLNESYYNFKEKLESILGFTKFEFLNITFSLNEIIESALSKLDGMYNKLVNDLINEIYDKSLEELKLTIKEVIKSRFNDIMNSIQNQYNATYNVFSNKSVTPSHNEITQLSKNSTYDPLLNLIQEFFNKVKEVYNQESLMRFIENIQDNQLKKFYIDTAFSDFYDIFMNQINDFLMKGEERLLQEKSEFLSNITIFYIKGFNQTIDSFYHIGINYLNSIISNDHLLKIVPDFRRMILFVNQTNDYLNSLLDDVFTKQISKLMANKLNNAFLSVRNEILDIFSVKMDIIYFKINGFKNNILELIPTFFLDRLSNEIQSDYMKKTLGNEKIYNLLYYNFTDALKANLSSILNEKIDLLYFYEDYKEKIQNNLTELTDILREYHYSISKRAASASQTYNMNTMTTIIIKYQEWVNQLKNLSDVYNFEVIDSKKNLINELYNKIIPNLNKINNDFIDERKDQEKNMKKVVDNYKIGDLLIPVKKELEGSLINSNIIKVKQNIIQIMENLKYEITNKFNNISQKLKNNFTKPLTGFNEKGKYRNLKEKNYYNIYTVEHQINIIEQRYKKFRNEIKLNENMTLLKTKKESFISKLIYSIEHMDDRFNNYRNDISYFIDANNIIDEIEKNSLNVKNYLKLFLIYLQSNISEFTDVLKGKIDEGWDEIKEQIDISLTEFTFNPIFRTLFKNLKLYNKTIINEKIKDDFLNEINTKDLVFLNDDKGDPLLLLDLVIKSIDLQYGYSINTNNTYNFTVDIFANAKVNAEIKFEVLEYYQSNINGVLGSGTIGFTPYYSLYDKSVDVNAYVFVDDTSYNNLYKMYNFDNDAWDFMKEKNVTEKGNSNMNFWKSFKSEEIEFIDR